MSAAQPPTSDTLNLTCCEVDLVRGRVLRDGQSMALSALEIGALTYLREHAGEVVDRDDLLAAVWGFDAAVITRAVDNTISRLRRKLEVDPSAPHHIITVHGAGYRFVLPPASQSPSPSQAAAPAAAPRTSFVGRQDELDRLLALIDGGARHITLVGPGGMGKTRLATRFAAGHHGLEALPFVDLSEAFDEAALLQAASRALGVPTQGDVNAVTQQLARALAARGDCLLLLDNAEQVVGPCAAALAAWLEAAPALRALVTSREPLRLPTEMRLPLRPFQPDEGVTLFLARAALARGGAQLSPAESPAIAALVMGLDGLPLAIELAAARTGALSPADIHARLGSHLAILGERLGGPGRHATVEATVAWSWELLSADEQALLAHLSVFRGSFTLAAAEGTAPAHVGDVAATLASLVDRSLVATEQGGRGLQYRLYVLVKAFARARLGAFAPSRGVTAAYAASASHAGYYVAEAQGWARGLLGSDPAPAAEALRSEAANLSAAVTWAVAQDVGLAARLLPACRWLAVNQGPLAPWLAHADQALDASAGNVPPAALGPVHLLRGELRHLSGDMRGAQADYEAAERIGAAPDLAHVGIEASIRLGVMELLQGRPAIAEGRLCEAAARSKEAGMTRLEGLARDRLGALYHVKGRPGDARGQLARAERAHHRAGAAALAAESRANLALMDLELGRLEGVRARLESAIELYSALSARRNEVLLRINLAAAQQAEGALDEAICTLEHAITTARRHGLSRSEGMALCALSLALSEQGQLAAARDRALDAQRSLHEVGEPLFEGGAWAALGVAEALAGLVEESEDAFAEAMSTLSSSGAAPPLAAAVALSATADLARARRDGDAPSAARVSQKLNDARRGSAEGGLYDRSSQLRAAVHLVETALKAQR